MGGRSGMRLGLVVAAAGVSVLACAQTALAGGGTTPDANDRPGPLDIKSAAQGHQGSRVTHTITTFSSWGTRLLGTSTPNYFAVEISTDADRAPERIVLMFSAGGRMVPGVFRPTGQFVGLANASRPNGRSVRVSILRSRLGSPAGYRWQALAFYRAPGPCRRGCLDRAPNGSGRVLHDLTAPTISFQPPEVPADISYDVEFSVADTGGAGIASWRLEHRLFGTTTWATVHSGATAGPQTFPQVSAADQDDEFRVVAVDGHGTTTTSPVRIVSVPVDDASFTYVGTWTTGGTVDDFLGTRHDSSDAGSARASYVFSGTYVAWVAPGGGGMADVWVDGLFEGTVDLVGFSGPRQLVFQGTFSDVGPHTIEIRVLVGPVSVDGIVVR